MLYLWFKPDAAVKPLVENDLSLVCKICKKTCHTSFVKQLRLNIKGFAFRPGQIYSVFFLFAILLEFFSIASEVISFNIRSKYE